MAPLVCDNGEKMLLTRVAYENDGSIILGMDTLMHTNRVRDSKNFIGKSIGDEHVQQLRRTLTHFVKSGVGEADNSCNISIKGIERTFTPEEVLAEVLNKIYALAEL